MPTAASDCIALAFPPMGANTALLEAAPEVSLDV